MPDSIIAVIDETGTTNHPALASNDDFGVAAILFSQSQVGLLAETSREIGKILHEKDFKFKHVQRNTLARRAFLEVINKLLPPSGVYGFFAPGASIAEEARRTLAVVKRKGLNDAEEQKIVDELSTAPRAQLMETFLATMTSCLSNYAFGWKREVQVYWDRRTDLNSIQKTSEYHDRISQFILSNLRGEHSHGAKFMGEAPRELAPIARLAGVIAGDVLSYFRRHGPRIWPHLKPQFDIHPADPRLDNYSIKGVLRTTKVATIQEMISDPAPSVGSPDTCLLQGYSKRFISNLLSFYAPSGSMGHLSIERGNRWHIHQNPN